MSSPSDYDDNAINDNAIDTNIADPEAHSDDGEIDATFNIRAANDSSKVRHCDSYDKLSIDAIATQKSAESSATRRSGKINDQQKSCDESSNNINNNQNDENYDETSTGSGFSCSFQSVGSYSTLTYPLCENMYIKNRDNILIDRSDITKALNAALGNRLSEDSKHSMVLIDGLTGSNEDELIRAIQQEVEERLYTVGAIRAGLAMKDTMASGSDDMEQKALDIALTGDYKKLNIMDTTTILSDQTNPVPIRTVVMNDQKVDLAKLCILAANAVETLSADLFWECFEGKPRQSWNWNWYLYPFWIIGVIIRYCILLPLRCIIFVFSVLITALMLVSINGIFSAKKFDKMRNKVNERLLRAMISCILFSFMAVINVHGALPKNMNGKVYVCNHSTPIDYVVLCSQSLFSVIGQLHKGWFGWMQKNIFESMDPLWFDRNSTKERDQVKIQIRDHVNDKTKKPLLIFPEGVCLNNNYVVQFKKTAFSLGTEVVPMAIKYNDLLSPHAFWNSRTTPPTRYIIKMWSSWCLYADIWFMEPTAIKPDETPEDFAKRVQYKIAKTAGLKARNWNGYLKYIAISDKIKKQTQRNLTRIILGMTEAELQSVQN